MFVRHWARRPACTCCRRCRSVISYFWVHVDTFVLGVTPKQKVWEKARCFLPYLISSVGTVVRIGCMLPVRTVSAHTGFGGHLHNIKAAFKLTPARACWWLSLC
jgi:hypothetical protein